MLTNIKSYQMHDTNHIKLLLSGKHINFIQSIEHSFSQSFQSIAQSRTQENPFSHIISTAHKEFRVSKSDK